MNPSSGGVGGSTVPPDPFAGVPMPGYPSVRDTPEPGVYNAPSQPNIPYNQQYQQQMSLNPSGNYPSVQAERIESDIQPPPAPAPAPKPAPAPAPAPAKGTAPKAAPPSKGAPDGSAQLRNLGKNPVVVECPSCHNRKRSNMKFNHCEHRLGQRRILLEPTLTLFTAI
ncbi:hypothetical protein NDN08_005871 [Rhodosorus marinus]|uniref:LITAF domain-containing protein n=1 Tax=Rhodosorus marinus TaxID=101924 RepID=A0AAV8V4F7_9RHOD|nr:hypothetical protein NDN08_005871 [Rhodosorus marinus]